MTTRRDIMDAYSDQEIKTLAERYWGLAAAFFSEHVARGGRDIPAIMGDGYALADELCESELSPMKMQRTAYEWLKTLVAAGFSGTTGDPRAELAAMKRRLLTASLVCIEAGDLDDAD